MPNKKHGIFDKLFFQQLKLDSLDPVSALREVLLWRGFLVRPSSDGRRVLLADGSTQQDFYTLRRLLSSTSYSITREREVGSTAAIACTISDERVLYRIFSLAPINGMVGTLESKAGWLSFSNQSFGHKVDTEHLEPGVALTVKTLPLARVRTYMSCDGHGNEWPRFWFAGRFNRLWWEAQLATIFAEHTEIKWIKEGEPNDHSLSLRLAGSSGITRENLIIVFSTLQNMMRKLLSDEVVKNIGLAKKTAVQSLASHHTSPDNIILESMCFAIQDTMKSSWHAKSS